MGYAEQMALVFVFVMTAVAVELQPGPRPEPMAPIELGGPGSSGLKGRWEDGDSTITIHNVTIYPTSSSNGGAKPGITSRSNSIIGVDEASPFESSYIRNNITEKVEIDLAPGKTTLGTGVLNQQVTLSDIDYIRMWTKRDFLTEFGHDYYVSIYTALEHDGDDQGSFYNTLLQGETGYFPHRRPYDKRNLGNWMYTDTRTPANFSGDVHGESSSFFPGAPYILGSGFSWYDWNRCENIGFYTAPVYVQLLDRDFTWSDYPHAGPTSTDPKTPYVDKPVYLLRFQSSLSTPDWETFVGAISRIEVGIAFSSTDLHLITYDFEAYAPSPSPTPSPLPPGVSYSPTPSPSATPSPRPPPPEISGGWPQSRGDESNAGFFKGGIAKNGKARIEYVLPDEGHSASRAIIGPAAITSAGNETYVLTAGGLLYGVWNDGVEFSTEWSMALGSSAPRKMGPVLLDSQKVVVAGTSNGKLWAVKTPSGNPLWHPAYLQLPLPDSTTLAAPVRVTHVTTSDSRARQRLDSLLHGLPKGAEFAEATRQSALQIRRDAIDDGDAVEVLLATAGGRLFVVDADEGELLWGCDAPDGETFVNGVVASFVTPYMYATTSAGALFAFDGSFAAEICPIVESDDDGDDDGSGVALKACNLCAEWVSYTDEERYNTPGEDAPTPVDAPSVDYVSRRVLVATKAGEWGTGRVYAYDLGEHSPDPYILFSAQPAPITAEDTSFALAPTAALIVANGDTSGSRHGTPVLYAGDDIGRVFAVFAGDKDGAGTDGYDPIWSAEVGLATDGDGVAHGTASGAISNGTLVVWNTENQVVALKVGDGTQKWIENHPSTTVTPNFLPAAAPAVTNIGSVVATTRGGSLLTFAAPCAALDPPPNGRITCSKTSTGLQRCKFHCNVGYYPFNTNHPMKTECRIDGKWTEGVPECVELQCSYKNWKSFSSCSVTCGGGTRSRTREVKNAIPPGTEEFCVETSETETCNTKECPKPSAKTPPFVQYKITVPEETTDTDDDAPPEWTPSKASNFRQNVADAINGGSNDESTKKQSKIGGGTKILIVKKLNKVAQDLLGATVKAEHVAITEVELVEGARRRTRRRQLQGTSYAWDVDFRVEVPKATPSQLQAVAVALTTACSSGSVNGTCADSSSLEVVDDPSVKYGSTTISFSWAEVGVIVLATAVFCMIGVLGCFAYSNYKTNRRLRSLQRKQIEAEVGQDHVDRAEPLLFETHDHGPRDDDDDDEDDEEYGSGAWGRDGGKGDGWGRGDGAGGGARRPSGVGLAQRSKSSRIAPSPEASGKAGNDFSYIPPPYEASKTPVAKADVWGERRRPENTRVLTATPAAATAVTATPGDVFMEAETPRPPSPPSDDAHALPPDDADAGEDEDDIVMEHVHVHHQEHSDFGRPDSRGYKPTSATSSLPPVQPRRPQAHKSPTAEEAADIEAALGTFPVEGSKEESGGGRHFHKRSKEASPSPPPPPVEALPEVSTPPVAPPGVTVTRGGAPKSPSALDSIPTAESFNDHDEDEDEDGLDGEGDEARVEVKPPMTRHRSNPDMGKSGGLDVDTEDRPASAAEPDRKRKPPAEPGRAGDEDSPPGISGNWGHKVGPRRVVTGASPRGGSGSPASAAKSPVTPGKRDPVTGRVPRRIKSRTAMIAAGVAATAAAKVKTKRKKGRSKSPRSKRASASKPSAPPIAPGLESSPYLQPPTPTRRSSTSGK